MSVAVIFDMDGTLLEMSREDTSWLIKAVQKVLSDRDISEDLTDEEKLHLAGIDSFEEYSCVKRKLGVSEDLFQDICITRAAYKLKTLESGRKKMIDGAVETIKRLKQDGHRVGVVSNSPEKSLEEVLRFFDLESSVDFYRGIQNEHDLRRQKPDSFLIEIAEAEMHERSVYVGDSRVDRIAADRDGIESLIIGEDVDSVSQVPDRV